MKRPVIGVVPLVDEEKESYWMLPGYIMGIEEASRKIFAAFVASALR